MLFNSAGGQGVAEVDFGTHPGSELAVFVVTGQTSISASSVISAWLLAVATTDHSVDEHIVDGPAVFAGALIPGTGFTIFADAGDRGGRLYGKFSVAWAWKT